MRRVLMHFHCFSNKIKEDQKALSFYELSEFVISKSKLQRSILNIILICCVFLLSISIADSEMMPKKKKVFDPTEKHYLKLVPDKRPKGFVYKIRKYKDSLLYRVDGWYSFSVLLSVGGRYIVRLGHWPLYNEPADSTLAIGFYNRGLKIKEYMISDLMEDVNNVERSVSHYHWGGGLKWTPESHFEIVEVSTVENIKIKFDIRTGEILERIQL